MIVYIPRVPANASKLSRQVCFLLEVLFLEIYSAFGLDRDVITTTIFYIIIWILRNMCFYARTFYVLNLLSFRAKKELSVFRKNFLREMETKDQACK